MFRRYPYWGWLTLSLALWCINGYDFRMHRQALLPDRMAHDITKDLKHRSDVFEGFKLERGLIRRIFSDSLTQGESQRINNLPFYLYAYQNDTLKLWNTNAIIAPYSDTALNKTSIVRNEKGVFVEECIAPFPDDSGKRLVVLIPVFISYPLENEYVKSHFVASGYIPVGTKILTRESRAAEDYPISMQGNAPLFFLHFNMDDIQQWTPDTLFFILLIAALLASMSWIQLMTIYHTKNDSPLAGFVITVQIIFILRWLLYIYGVPFNLDKLTFFSPQLYASNKYLTSLGDLCINTFCVLWIVVFITRHTPYRTFFARLRGKWARAAATFLLLAALISFVFLFVYVTRSLVTDSKISFNVGQFYTIDIYTIIGLFVIGTITGLSCLIIYLLNVQLNTLIYNIWYKYLLIAIAGMAYLFLANCCTDPFYWALVGWLLLFTAVLDIPDFTLVSDLFEPRMIFWAVFICLFCTALLQYFTIEKEHVTRIQFAEKTFAPDPEYDLELSFNKSAKKIEQDKKLKDFFERPTANGRKLLDKYFDSLYLAGPVSKYDLKIYFFDAGKNGLFNKDNSDFTSFENEKNESATTNSPYLFYNESILERHYYLSLIKIYKDTINDELGYVVINMDRKKPLAGTVYPELLQPSTVANELESSNYAYALYVNGKLIKQTNDKYPFTTYLKENTLNPGDYRFYYKNRTTELHYNIGDKRTIVVVDNQNQALEAITLFSYIFGMLVLLAIAILLYQLYLSYFSGAFSGGRFMSLTLRRRVQFAMLTVVLLSFIVIGSVTIVFFYNQYQTSNETRLQAAMVSAKQSVQDLLKSQNAYRSGYIFDTVTRSGGFKTLLTSVATGQKIDINLFDNRGTLLSASQDDIYTKGLISMKMRPDAYYQLNNDGKSIVIQNENVALLSYLSAYEPLRDENGAALGYINVPFFQSEKNLRFQISNIVVTLINLYAFIFLISSFVTVVITRWITSTFNIIIRQFGRLNLQQNERITWPYNDEIGLLVAEYNKMVNKVEENAAKLAQSERERAWREMARQVAHEIKNPLTPMKLNIQYLQQAVRNDSPNIKELTNKVADSIVEQINNLSYIASEFSNFAKMPEARAEEIDLPALLHKAVELHLSDAKIKLSISDDAQTALVLSDHSQLLRVFTNLIENAIQAIPDGRTGQIAVAMILTGENVIISISDNGKGISDEIKENIFQPYFTTKTSGTGLGLAMTRKIIEFWKGQIWFETKEGTGTTFFIKLPVVG